MKNKSHVLRMKQKGWGVFILLFFAAAFAVQAPLQASATKTRHQVEYIHERLTVDVDNVALGSVLAAIREKTGIEYVLNREHSEGLISVRFESLPLAEGLKRILSHFNHVLLFGPDNKRIKVIILGYAESNNSLRPHGVAETTGVQRVVSPSSAEAKDMLVTSSSGGMNIHQFAGEGMVPIHSLEKTLIQNASAEDMFVTPPTETMVVTPASVEMIVMPPSVEMVIVPPSPEAMASLGN